MGAYVGGDLARVGGCAAEVMTAWSGPEHNLFQFYRYGLTKEAPPGTNVRVLSDPRGSEPEEPPAGPSTSE